MQIELEGEQFYAIDPKTNCPHILPEYIAKTEQTLLNQKKKIFKLPCKECQNIKENWICLVCNEIYCSRYVNKHMVEHCLKEKHAVALSFSDLSFWCYECDSYITNSQLGELREKFANFKFSENDQNQQQSQQSQQQKEENEQNLEEIKKDQDLSQNNINQIELTQPLSDKIEEENQEQLDQKQEKMQQKQEITKQIKQEKIINEKNFSYNDFISGIKKKKFTKIVFFTGIGISSNQINSHKQQKYLHLDELIKNNENEIFYYNHYNKNPLAYYKMFAEFLNKESQPTIAHKFQVILQQRNQLLLSITENIDSLELIAGLNENNENNLIQLNGHLRTFHCTNCFSETSLQSFQTAITTSTILPCPCGGIFKPDIVFHGENLQKKLFNQIQLAQDADLVIVIGTELEDSYAELIYSGLVRYRRVVVIGEQNEFQFI